MDLYPFLYTRGSGQQRRGAGLQFVRWCPAIPPEVLPAAERYCIYHRPREMRDVHAPEALPQALCLFQATDEWWGIARLRYAAHQPQARGGNFVVGGFLFQQVQRRPMSPFELVRAASSERMLAFPGESMLAGSDSGLEVVAWRRGPPESSERRQGAEDPEVVPVPHLEYLVAAARDQLAGRTVLVGLDGTPRLQVHERLFETIFSRLPAEDRLRVTFSTYCREPSRQFAWIGVFGQERARLADRIRSRQYWVLGDDQGEIVRSVGEPRAERASPPRPARSDIPSADPDPGVRPRTPAWDDLSPSQREILKVIPGPRERLHRDEAEEPSGSGRADDEVAAQDPRASDADSGGWRRSSGNRLLDLQTHRQPARVVDQARQCAADLGARAPLTFREDWRELRRSDDPRASLVARALLLACFDIPDVESTLYEVWYREGEDLIDQMCGGVVSDDLTADAEVFARWMKPIVESWRNWRAPSIGQSLDSLDLPADTGARPVSGTFARVVAFACVQLGNVDGLKALLRLISGWTPDSRHPVLATIARGLSAQERGGVVMAALELFISLKLRSNVDDVAVLSGYFNRE